MAAETTRFPLDYDATAAYAAVNRLASYTQKKLSGTKFNPAQGDAFAKMTGQARAFSQTLEFANDRMVAFAATTTIVYGLGKAFVSLYNNAIKAEKALADIQVNVKLTNQEMTTLTSDLFKAANATGNSFYTAATAAAEFGRQGLKAAEIARATASALVLTQISGMDVTESVKSLTAAINTFGKDAIQYESLVNKMAAADTNFAVSSKDIAEAISRVGSTAKDAGIGIDQLIAAVTSVQQTTARGGSAIGNAFKTIFTKLQSDETAAALENVGIKTKDAEGNFLSAIDVLKDLATSYDTLTDSQQANVSKKIGGTYQINIVKALIGDLSKATSTYGQALATVGRAQNEAFIKSEFLGRTAVNKINEAKNSFIQFSDAIGKLGLNSAAGDIAEQISSALQGAAESLNKSVDTAGFGDRIGQSVVKGIVDAISGPGLGIVAAGLTRLSLSILGRFKADVGGIFFGRGASQTSSRSATIIEENRQRLVAIQQEKIFESSIIRGNAALLQRLAIMSKMVNGTAMGANFALPTKPSSTFKGVSKSFAGGMLPAAHKEIKDISNGVGGASRRAKPIAKKIVMKAGGIAQPVVVNSNEVIVRNYMGSGADAVFNQDMIKKVGGIRKVREMGKAENVAGQSILNFSRGLGTVLGRGVDGAYSSLKGKVGVKRYGDYSGNPDKIQNEYAYGKILSENKLIPGITGPEIFGSLKRSIIESRVGKQVETGSLVGKTGIHYDYPNRIQSALEGLLQRKGVPAYDLHGGNVMQNQEATNFFKNPRAFSLLRGRVNRIREAGGAEKLERLFGKMQKAGGRISIVDTGHFGDLTPASGDLYKKFQDISKGGMGYFPKNTTVPHDSFNIGSNWPNMPMSMSVPLRKSNAGKKLLYPQPFKPNFQLINERVPPPKKPNARVRGQGTENFERALREGKPLDYFDKGTPPNLFKKIKANFGFASGFVPNFSRGLGKILGSGVDGSFSSLRSGIGVKRYADKKDPDKIAREYAFGKILSENKIVPGVSGPKIIGSLTRSVREGRVGKTVEGGSLVEDAIRGDYKWNLKSSLEHVLRSKGLPASDLHGANLMQNEAATKFFSNPKAQNLLEKIKGQIGTKKGSEKNIGRILATMERAGGRISIIDTGHFDTPKPGTPFYDEYANTYSKMAGIRPRAFDYLQGNSSIGPMKSFSARMGGGPSTWESRSNNKSWRGSGSYAGGFTPNLAIGRIYRGIGKDRGKGPWGAAEYGLGHGATAMQQLKDDKALMQKVIQHQGANSAGLSYSSSKHPSSTLKFLDPSFGGKIVSADMRIFNPKVFERYKKILDNKGAGQAFGSNLASMAAAKPFGIDASLASKHIGKSPGYVAEREINVFDPKRLTKWDSMTSVSGKLAGASGNPKIYNATHNVASDAILGTNMASKKEKFRIKALDSWLAKKSNSAKKNFNFDKQLPTFSSLAGTFPGSSFPSTQANITSAIKANPSTLVPRNIFKSPAFTTPPTQTGGAGAGGGKPPKPPKPPAFVPAPLPLPPPGKGLPKNNNDGVKKLIKIIKDPSATTAAKEDAKKLLDKKGVLGKYSSVSLGLPPSMLSDKALINFAKSSDINGPVYSGVKAQLDRKGVFKNPDSINKGLPMSMLDPAALKTIAQNKGGKYSKIQSTGAAKLRLKLAEEKKIKLKDAQMQKANPTAYQMTKANGKSLPDNIAALKSMGKSMIGSSAPPIDAPNKNQKTLMASSDFRAFVGQNPYAKSSDIKQAALGIMGQTKGVISDKEIKAASKETKRNRNQRFAGKIGTAGFVGTMAGSALGDQLGSPGAGQLLSNVGLGATLGSSFGPIGAAAGALAGVTLSLSSQFKKSVVKFEAVNKAIEGLTTETEKQQLAVQSFVSANEKFDTIIRDPNSSTEAIRTVAREKASSLASLPDDVRRKLLDADSLGGEEGKSASRDALNAFTQKSQNKLNSETALASIIGNADKNNNSVAALFRALTRSRDDSRGRIQLDDTDLNKSIQSFVSNFDLGALKEKAENGDETTKRFAKVALDSREAGDFEEFLRVTRVLGLVGGKTSDAILSLEASSEQLNNAFKRSVQDANKVAEIQAELEKKIQSAKVAFEDFTSYQTAFSRKNALESSLGTARSTLSNARLGIIANQAGVPDSAKQTIGYAQEISGLDEQKRTLSTKLSESLMKVVGDSYNASGRNVLNKENGPTFIKDFLKGGLSAEGAEKTLDLILKTLDESSAFDSAQKDEIRSLSNEFKNNTLQIITAKQIAIEQLKALQEISRKQQFDKLIDSIRGRDTTETAFKNLDFASLRRELLAPTSAETKKENDIKTNAVRNRNSEPLYSIIGRKNAKIKEALDLDDEKKSRGEKGFGAGDRSSLILQQVRGKTAEQFDIESKLRMEQSRGNNLGSGLMTRQAFEKSRMIVAGGEGGEAGSIENMKKAMQVLLAAASELSPGNKDRALLVQQADDIKQSTDNQTGSSGIFKEAQLKISLAIEGLTKKMESMVDNTPEKKAVGDEVARLQEASRGLSTGRSKEAIQALEFGGKNADIINAIKNPGITPDGAVKDSVGQQQRDQIGIVDWTTLSTNTGAVASSNKLLNDAILSLTTEISSLNGMMIKQANVAGLSVESVGLGEQIALQEKKKRELESKFSGGVTTEEIDYARKRVVDEDFKDGLSGIQTTASQIGYMPGVPIAKKDKAAEIGEAARYVQSIVNSGRINPERKLDRTTEGDINLAKEKLEILKTAYPDKNSQRGRAVSDSERIFSILERQAQGESRTPETALQIEELVKSINALVELQKTKDAERANAIATPPSSTPASKTQASVDVSGNINVNGVEAFAGLTEKINKTIRDHIMFQNANPNAFDAGFGPALPA